MLSLGPLAFTAPWLLAGLIALPLFWWLLRLLPPAPRRIPFPAVRLLFGLGGEETTPKAAPWWLTLLRLAIVALVILAAARPVLNPEWQPRGSGPLILAMDDGWTAAPAWTDRQDRAISLLDAAERANRPVYLLLGAPPASGDPLAGAELMAPQAARERVAALTPKPWPADRAAMAEAATGLSGRLDEAETVWLSDGLDAEGTANFAEALGAIGPLTVFAPPLATGPLALTPPDPGASDLTVTVKRAEAGAGLNAAIIALSEAGRPLARRDLRFDPGDTEISVTLDLPVDLRNDVTRLVLENAEGAAASVLLDGRWSRRPVGIVADIGSRESLPLLSETYFLDRALRPLGTVDRGPASILLRTPQSMLLLPDQTVLESGDVALLESWVRDGGMLIRFAGPRLAAEADPPLVPVALRGGGRQLSGAMLWTEPATIGAVSEDGPFAGMRIPEDVTVTRQVLAEPSLELDGRTWMRLADDTPLVTADRLGSGWLVLVHTTANTEWSDMALSGMYVDMLRRLGGMGRGVRDAADEQGILPPYRSLDGFGRLGAPPASARPLTAAGLADATVSAAAPPGYYGTEAVRIALNLGAAELTPLDPQVLPADTRFEAYAQSEERPLVPYLLLAALLLLIADTALTAALRGFGLRRPRGATAVLMLATAVWLVPIGPAAAQQSGGSTIPVGAQQTTLAYVLTGSSEVDAMSRAGLSGLSRVLRDRTAIEAGEPVGIDIARDELAFYPLIYWPVTEDGGRINTPTADRINRFLAGGGMILFDTRDGHLAGSRMMNASPALRRLAQRIDIPPLAAVPPDHVLTRSFYLMQTFPGRWEGGTLWVETGGSMTNDGVSPIVVGDADWAAAWATDEFGRPLVPVGGEGSRQREMAYRFGVNLVMYTLTGNYKADQVHIPSILERLGQ
jgi:hypothetical protein